ncbi:hypothetical protein HFP43_00235 [Streptomyces sp. SJ1-7]|nr:hypothetical protein [Streptomyces sp. SJ1-7]
MADFRIEPYVKFPAAQTTPPINSNVQEIREFNRSDPGPSLPVFAANGAVKHKAKQERSCGKPDDEGRTLCIELSPPTAESKARAKQRSAALREAEADKARKAGKSVSSAVAPAVELVDWCSDKPGGKDYMTRARPA